MNNTIPTGPTTTTGRTNNVAMNNDQPPVPAWLFFIYCAQLFFAVLVMALAAYGVHIFGPPLAQFLGYIYGALGFTIFCAIWTLLVSSALICIPRFCPQFYFKWVLLGVIAMTTLFWLISFSMLASWANGVNYGSVTGATSGPDYVYRKRETETQLIDGYVNDYTHYLDQLQSAWKCTCAAAAFGAVLWILFVVTLVFYGLGCYQYRTNRAPASSVEGGVSEAKTSQTMPMQQYPNNNNNNIQTAMPAAPDYHHQQQQQYAQSGVSTYAPTPNPEHQMHLQQQQPYMPEQAYQQPISPVHTGQGQYVNPQFGGQPTQPSHEMPTHQEEGV